MHKENKNLEQFISNFEQFEQNFNGQKSESIQDLRKIAINHLLEKGFPTMRDEEWRFTDINPILTQNFNITPAGKESNMNKSDIDHLLYKNWNGPQLVFIDGYFAKHLSNLNVEQAGITLDSLATIIKQDQQTLMDAFTNYETFNENAFSALNTAFISDGVILKVEKNVIAKQPIHLLYIATENEKAQFINPRNIIFMSESSQATIVESFFSLGSNQYFNNPVTEIRNAENTKLNHIKVQNESDAAFHIGSIFVDQKQNSNYFSTSVSFGGKIARNNIYTKLDGEGIETTLNGLYMGNGNQLTDNNTFIDHSKPHCNSHEIYQGILTDKAHGVFSGTIMVHRRQTIK